MIDMGACLTCKLMSGRDEGHAPLWDSIYRTDHWDLVHSYNTALPEAAELGVLLQRASAALREVVGCAKTYVVQFAEAAEHHHVHFHVIPRMADQPEERRSLGIFGYLGVPEEQRVSEDGMNRIAVQIRRLLTNAH